MLLLIILLPVALAAFCAMQKDDFRRWQIAVMLLMQAAATALCAAVFCTGRTYATAPLTFARGIFFSLQSDAFGSFFALLTAICWLFTILYASVYMKHEHREPRFYCFLFLTEASVLGAAFAGDMMTLYLFYELTTVCSTPLVLHSLTGKALMGATKYLYYSIAGAFIALFGIAVLYQQGVSMFFVRGGTAAGVSAMTLVAAFCVILGFCAKAGLFPMHNWLPYAHPVAPAPAHALLSGIITKVGVVGSVRLIYFMLGADRLRGTCEQTALIALALLTVFMGSFMGVTEDGLKKRLAYSSISNLSYVLLGVFMMTPLGLVGALLQIFFHALAKIGIFQCAGAIIFLTETDTISGFPGLGKRIPLTMLCFTGLSLSLVGIPPFGGFYSKWYLALAGLDGMTGLLRYTIPAVLLISALLTGIYLFWPITCTFFPGRDHPAAKRVHEPWRMMLSLVSFTALCLILGALHPAVVTVMERITGTIL